MLFSGKKNVFMCLVAFQKIFSDVWLCSWKYHRKHILYLLLTFSRIFLIAKRIYNIIHSSKHNQNPEKNHQSFERSAQCWWCRRDRDRRGRSFTRPRSKLRAITIEINASRDRRDAGDVSGRYRQARIWTISTLSSFFLPLSLSLTLSLFCVWPRNGLKVKWKCKTISGSKE